jgi:hypothetical protein
MTTLRITTDRGSSFVRPFKGKEWCDVMSSFVTWCYDVTEAKKNFFLRLCHPGVGFDDDGGDDDEEE